MPDYWCETCKWESDDSRAALAHARRRKACCVYRADEEGPWLLSVTITSKRDEVMFHYKTDDGEAFHELLVGNRGSAEFRSWLSGTVFEPPMLSSVIASWSPRWQLKRTG